MGFDHEFSRRRLLAAAGAGAGALATAHLLPFASPTHAAAAAPSAWTSPFRGSARARAAHLLRRTCFGYSTADLDAASAMPYRDLVEQILNQTPQRPAFPDAQSRTDRWKAVPVWINHMGTTRSPFPERMTLFWHGMLVSSDDKAQFGFDYMTLQMQMFRDRGLGDLRTLLLETAYSAAMMEYLDMEQSVAGAPNENFAREVMELMTLGPGNYTETDVRESARALTGYRIHAFDAGGTPQAWPEWGPDEATYLAKIRSLIDKGWYWKAALVPNKHDNTNKTFLGRTGNWGLEDIVDIILAQPACARFVAQKAIKHFLGDTAAASTTLLDDVSARFRSSGYDLKTLMRSILLGADYLAHAGVTGNAFLADDAYRSMLRMPIEYLIAAVKATGYTSILADCDWYATVQGQQLYNPPNVAGWWHGDAYWIGSAAWLSRINFASAVAWDGRNTNPDPAIGLRDQLDGVLSAATDSTYKGLTWTGDRWYTVIGSPEFQLK